MKQDNPAKLVFSDFVIKTHLSMMKAEGAHIVYDAKTHKHKIIRGIPKEILIPLPTPESILPKKIIKPLETAISGRLKEFKKTLASISRNPKKHIESMAIKDPYIFQECLNRDTEKCVRKIDERNNARRIYCCFICQNLKLKDIAKRIARLKESIKLNRYALKNKEVVDI